MATGRPVVASPVGVNTDIIQHGYNGLLAETSDQFVSALTALAADPDLRRRLGANARKTIEEKYSAEVVARAFAQVVRAAVR
jgi:glycosyltransferase involved in cell wall biosynthesis